MPRIALATASKFPHLTADDRLLLPPLAALGIEAAPAIWDDPRTDWSRFDAIVIRSCWDYHLKPEAFLDWIAKLEEAHIALFNTAALLCWNCDKSYLRDLEARDIVIVPTFWPGVHQTSLRGDTISLKDKLRELGWHKAVVKPRISATAHRTLLVRASDAENAQSHFEDLHRGPGVMVQRFVESIANEGEWSLLFFAGQFSHAVLKKPRAGDFRVQNDFGGTSQLADPPEHALIAAIRIIRAVEPTIYARVDGVVEDNQFHLMELELIEPMLFLADHSEAARRFAEAIAKALAPGRLRTA
jgi:hypothetical protein